MKTFGLFMILFITIVIGNYFLLDRWTAPEIIIESTILAYIMQQYFIKEIKNK